MGLTNPTDTVYKMTSLKRWQRDWLNSNKSINYSGLVQDMISQIISKHDSIYYTKHKPDKEPMRRKESTIPFISQISS